MTRLVLKHWRAKLLHAIKLFLYCFPLFSSPTYKLPFFEKKEFNPSFELYKENDLAMMDNFSFTNQFGKLMTEKDLHGKITVVNFFFSECQGICPMTLARLQRFKKRFDHIKNIQILSISITPNKDTPERLLKYSKELNIIDNNWFFLTGQEDSVLSYVRKIFQADKKTRTRGEKSFIHSDNVFLIDSKKRFRGIYNGQKTSSLNLLLQDLITISALSLNLLHHGSL